MPGRRTRDRQPDRRRLTAAEAQEAARRALEWCLNNQYAGPDGDAHGGLVGVSPQSAVGYRPWFRVSCTYASGFFGLAALEELKLQDRPRSNGG